MARLPRLDLPDIPQHIVQRGNNRLPCFLDDGDRLRYLQALQEALMTTGVQLHAYVLMDNHVHLLATPAAAGDIGRLMQRLGRQYVGLFNARHRRTGTLWEGRYKSCLVDSERYVLTCQRYIELDPVRARITDDAGRPARVQLRRPSGPTQGIDADASPRLACARCRSRAALHHLARTAGRSADRTATQRDPAVPATTTRLRRRRLPRHGRGIRPARRPSMREK